MRLIYGIMISVLLLWGSGCTPEVPQSSQKNESPNIRASGAAAKLSDSEYNALSNEQKYAVANKLMGTLYKGVPVSDFFNIEGGLENPALKSESSFLDEAEAALSSPLEDKAVYLARIEEKYLFDEVRKPMEYPLAALFEFPVSRDYFHRWIAYWLANSILFSPALENDSVDYTDIQDIQFRLVKMMEEGKSIREIVYDHMISQENWRRFRSPEDNTREMIEIFLGRFNQDTEVPKASIACKNWFLTDDEQGYQLVIGFDENTEPQQVLGATLLSCYDFYQVVAQHPLLIPRIASVLVDGFFVGYPPREENRAGQRDRRRRPDHVRPSLLRNPLLPGISSQCRTAERLRRDLLRHRGEDPMGRLRALLQRSEQPVQRLLVPDPPEHGAGVAHL